MFVKNLKQYQPLRRNLRNDQTPAERKVWNILRGSKFLGYRFLRQYGVERYILDFYCPKVKLAIEIDGGQHNDEREKLSDAERTRLLEFYRIRVLRFWNNEVMQNIEGVYEKIMQAIVNPPNPS